MKNRVIKLMDSLINQYEQLFDCKFDEDVTKAVDRAAKLKFQHHLSELETSIKQLINMRNPIYTYDGFGSKWDREVFVMRVKRAIDGEDERFNDEWERIAFIECVKKLTDGQLEPRFAKILDAYSDPVKNYYALVEGIERKNEEFKRRTVYFLMLFCDN